MTRAVLSCTSACFYRFLRVFMLSHYLWLLLVLVVTCFIVISPHVGELKTVFHSGGQQSSSLLFYSILFSPEFHRCVPNRIHLLVHSNTLQCSTLILWWANFLRTVSSQIAHCCCALIRSDNSKHCPLWIFTTCRKSDHKIQRWGQ